MPGFRWILEIDDASSASIGQSYDHEKCDEHSGKCKKCTLIRQEGKPVIHMQSRKSRQKIRGTSHKSSKSKSEKGGEKKEKSRRFAKSSAKFPWVPGSDAVQKHGKKGATSEGSASTSEEEKKKQKERKQKKGKERKKSVSASASDSTDKEEQKARRRAQKAIKKGTAQKTRSNGEAEQLDVKIINAGQGK